MDSPTFAFIHTLSPISEAASNAPTLDLGVAPPAEQPPVVEPPSPEQALVVQPLPPVANSSNNGGYTAFDDIPFMNISMDALINGDLFFQQTTTDVFCGQGIAAAQAVTEVDNVQGQSTTEFDQQPIVGVFVDQSTGELFVENRKDVLGRGTFGHVHEVSDVRGVKMALKMPTQHTRAKDIAKEVEFLTRLSANGGHRNVIKFHRTVQDLTGTGLLFELCHPRDFWQLLNKRGALLEEEVRYYGIQLLDGLAFMHDRGILHCDLKPNNILISKGMVLKIADVGMAEDIEEQVNKKFGQKVSTPGFVAPEIVKNGKHTPALDVFSMGCIFYLMIAGKQLELTDREAVQPLPDDFLQDFNATSNAKEVLRRMLEYDPHTRVKVPLLRTLPFFRQGYCPPSLPESAFDDPPSLMNDGKRQREEESIKKEESHGAKKIKQGHKGKAAIRGHVEAKVMAAIEFEDPVKAAEVYNAEVREAEVMSEEVNEMEMRLKEKKQELRDEKKKLMDGRIELRQKFGDGIVLKDVRPSDDV